MTGWDVSWAAYDAVFGRMIDRIAARGVDYGSVVAIGRRGFIPGAMVAEALGIPRLIGVQCAVFRQGAHRRSPPMLFGVEPAIDPVLIVDDAVWTGASMRAVTREYPKADRATLMVAGTCTDAIEAYGEIVARSTEVRWPWA